MVYDKLNTRYGGAEKVLLALHEIWPEAPLFTSYWDKKTADWALIFDVRTSFLQSLWEKTRLGYGKFVWLVPLAFENFDFYKFEVVISVSAEFAKSIITQPTTLHLCYCLTPPRWLWTERFKNRRVKELVVSPLLTYARVYDQTAAQRVDEFVAISEAVEKRIRKVYKRRAEVIYPPVDISQKLEIFARSGSSSHVKIQNGDDKDYFLLVSRLVGHKRVDLAIEVFNQLGLTLKIIGVGPEEKKLKKMAKANIEFLGELTSDELASYYQNCRVLVMPQEEDFGTAAIEAQSFGRPVIAFGRGGADETVKDGESGVKFPKQTVDSLLAAIRRFRKLEKEGMFEGEKIARWARSFRKEKFKKEFRQLVEKIYALRDE